MFRFGDLPAEIAVEVLAACANARGLGRALRMRLVSKKFSSLVIDAILRSDLLAQAPDPRLELWRTYLRRRVSKIAVKYASGVDTALRAPATHYSAEAGLPVDDALRTILLALCEPRALATWGTTRFNPPPEWWPEEDHVDQVALVAATALNNVGIVDAAIARHHDLALIESPGMPSRLADLGNPCLLQRVTYEALKKLSFLGNPDMIELYRKLSYEARGGSAPPQLKDTSKAKRLRITKDFYYRSRYWLRNAASRGHIQMLQYLIDVVFPMQQYPRRLSVAAAAGGFQTDTVRWLLRRGASPLRGHPLEQAVCSGSFEITEMLIENVGSIHTLGSLHLLPVLCGWSTRA